MVIGPFSFGHWWSTAHQVAGEDESDHSASHKRTLEPTFGSQNLAPAEVWFSAWVVQLVTYFVTLESKSQKDK